MTERQVFAPADPHSFIARQRRLLALGLLIGLVVLDDWTARLLLLGFAAVFGLMIHALLGWHLRQNRHALTLDGEGLHTALLATRYGTPMIPWREVAEIDLVAGPPRGSRWLRFALKPGTFRNSLTRPVGDRLVGRDVNLLCTYEAQPEVVLQAVHAFWRRHGATENRTD